MPLFISSDRADRLAQEAMAISHAEIQADFKQMVGNASHKMEWSEEEKKQFYDELSGDE